MAVTFFVPGYLQTFTGGRAEVAIEGSPSTVAEALAALFVRHPGVRDRIVDETGAVRRHVNVFVGNENIRWADGLATPVEDGSVLSVIQAVSGG